MKSKFFPAIRPAILFLVVATLWLLAPWFVRATDEPAVTVVVGADPDPLERRAAEELAGLMKTLFTAEVTLAERPPGDGATPPIVLLGNAAREFLPAGLGPQDHVVRSTSSGLVVAGGSPVATLWAVYEYGYANGMRYLTSGDFPPKEAPVFTLDGYDIVRKPRQTVRAWSIVADGPASQGSWPASDLSKLLGQLAKLKFNAVLLPGDDADLAFEPIGVTGDIAGRSVFSGAEEFAPLPREAVPAWRTEIAEAARALGMTTEMDAAPRTTLTLGQERGQVLPVKAPTTLPEGDFCVAVGLVGDVNPALHYLSRAAWDASVTPEAALDQLATPICGEGVAEALAQGFAALAEVSALMEEENPEFAVPAPEMFGKHYRSSEPAPEWWSEGKDFYGKAVNEMYRANTRARDGARPWILHHAKRHTFALHYFTAVESARNAALAREAKDNEAWAENLVLAIEALHNALGIYAEVADDHSDRGVIALLNEYAYRPMLEELDRVPFE